MSLAAGTRLGPYEILGFVGAGGMGEVYRASDTRLDRTVAIKVLPGGSASDPERRTRFEREARTISSLNHPHICALYDIGDTGGMPYLVMEYLLGETLAERLRNGALPVREALELGAQIAEALDAAHRHDIVHRDLKPGNVMLTTTGVKLLDFGLAKARRDDLPGIGAAASRTTAAEPLTERGAILGTVPYMSPEQLEGREADARSDIWALGAILYEMVTGRRAFEGTGPASLIRNIMEADPPALATRQPAVPPVLDGLVRRCLAKRSEDRWHSAHDLAHELRWISQSGSGPVSGGALATPRNRAHSLAARAAAIVAGILVVGLGALAFRWFRTPEPARGAAERQLALLTSSNDSVEDPALSPDGKMIAMVAEENGQADLFVSRVAGGARVRLTNDVSMERSPAFSPDGERVTFVRRDDAAEAPSVLTVPTLGGQAVVVTRGATAPAWSPDGEHLAVVTVPRDRSQELVVLRADGSAPRCILAADARYPFLRSPAWSPDGSELVVERSSGGAAGELWVVPSAGGAAARLTRDGPGVFTWKPRFTPDGRYIIHSSNRGGSTNLWLLPRDGSAAVQLTSGPGPDLSPSVALDGSVAFLNERRRHKLVVFDLDTGEARTLLTHTSPLWAPVFSPDGGEIAYSRAEIGGQWHIWTILLEGGPPRQLTSGASPEIYPRYTPDGRAVIYFSWDPGNNRIWMVPSTGGVPRALSAEGATNEQYGDVSPDGRRIAFVRTENDTSRIYIASIDGSDSPRPLLDSLSTLPRWSPDGRWIAFSRDRGTDSGVFVANTEGEEVRQLSQTGGWPVWWPTGLQLGFIVNAADGRQQVWVAPLDGAKAFRLDAVRHNTTNCPFDVSANGRSIVTTDAERIVSEVWLLKWRE